MELIDKDAIVAEIEKLTQPIYPTLVEKRAYESAIEECKNIILTSSLETKDVDMVNKSAVLEEIERQLHYVNSRIESYEHVDSTRSNAYFRMIGNRSVLESIKDFINNLEMKSVDLKEEVDTEDAVHGTVDFPVIGYDFPNIYPNYKELKEYCDRKGIKDNDKVKLIIIKDI